MKTIERILCPTDLSPASDEALRYGVALARAYGAELIVCHCLETSPLADPPAVTQIKKMLDDEIGAHVCLSCPNALDWKSVIVEGEPAAVITREAAARRVDLIVMRSRRRPQAATLLGSTAEAVCHTAPCPVLVTHPREREWAGFTSNEIALKRVLVAHDFSHDSEIALSYALSLAQEYQAELHLLHVLLPPGVDDLFEQAAHRLRHAVPEEVYLWCRVKQAVRAGKPDREILAYAEEQRIDLICMGIHGAGFGMRALFGSNVDRVLRQAPCPVLIARPRTPATIIPAGMESGRQPSTDCDHDHRTSRPAARPRAGEGVQQ
jgi:nucleotide-binding universal stress UspA family protein